MTDQKMKTQVVKNDYQGFKILFVDPPALAAGQTLSMDININSAGRIDVSAWAKLKEEYVSSPPAICR